MSVPLRIVLALLAICLATWGVLAEEPPANQPRIVIRVEQSKDLIFRINGLARTEKETKDWLAKISATAGRQDPIIIFAELSQSPEPAKMIYRFAQEHFDRAGLVVFDESRQEYVVITENGDDFREWIRRHVRLPKISPAQQTTTTVSEPRQPFAPDSTGPVQQQIQQFDSLEKGRLPGSP
ncbi:hypothetical protein TSACC_22945 [Terrimicrobium sacchariphilum]|uniref:DUF4174 domain-containing protein n=1 Tax=Terrimicrobium sacchariphilum TaxID=690879 RepID=A0A146GAP7_TERSA|nr:hypothetical protein [Terrimicrobium sacchariphilum]GAT34520.1 hypothetical protein TSACC_22945 [Terrimicrobium sacchariphilum]